MSHSGREQGENFQETQVLPSHVFEGKQVQPSAKVKSQPGTLKDNQPHLPS